MMTVRFASEARVPDRERELGELSRGVLRVARLGHPRTHRVAMVVLAVLAAVCVAATVTRLSPLPLLPLPALVVAAYGNYRARHARDDRRLLYWSSVLVGGLLLGFWLISVIGGALPSSAYEMTRSSPV